MTLSVNSNTGQDTFDLCLGEFGEIGYFQEELADPIGRDDCFESFHPRPCPIPYPIIAVAAISNFLFRHTFLLRFPFYNPNTVNLHVLMVPSIEGTINAMLLPCCFSFSPLQYNISHKYQQEE